MQSPIIETERLIIREIKNSDVLDMFEYAQLPIVGPVAGWAPHRNTTDTKNVIQMFRDKKKYGQLPTFAVVLKKEDKMIGTVELHTYIRGYKAELGYTINPNYWGNGYAFEASKAILKWGFTELLLKRVECSTFVFNKQSRRICEKLQMTYEGYHKKGYILYDGSIHDVYCYAMTDDEYFELYQYNDDYWKLIQD